MAGGDRRSRGRVASCLRGRLRLVARRLVHRTPRARRSCGRSGWRSSRPFGWHHGRSRRSTRTTRWRSCGPRRRTGLVSSGRSRATCSSAWPSRSPRTASPGEETLLAVGVAPSSRGRWPRAGDAAGARRGACDGRHDRGRHVGVAERDCRRAAGRRAADRDRDPAPARRRLRDRAGRRPTSGATTRGRSRRCSGPADAPRSTTRTSVRNVSGRLYSPSRGRAHRKDPLAPFGPAVRAWFEATFEAPTPAQAEGWAAISRGRAHADPRPDRQRQDPRRVPVVPRPAGPRARARADRGRTPAPSAPSTSARSRR